MTPHPINSAVTSSINLAPEHLQLVCDILARHVPSCAVWVFGSRVTGKAKPFSDLDLAILSPQPLSLDTRAALTDDFAESDLPIKVDVVDWQTISDAFRKIIAKHKVVLVQA